MRRNLPKAFQSGFEWCTWAVLKVRDNLHAIKERFQILGVDMGVLKLSRFRSGHDDGVQIKNVKMYSTAWVKSQARMAATSNQETWQVDIAGRVVLDLLRCGLAILLRFFTGKTQVCNLYRPHCQACSECIETAIV